MMKAPGTIAVARLTICMDPAGLFSVVVEALDGRGGTDSSTLGLKHASLDEALREARGLYGISMASARLVRAIATER